MDPVKADISEDLQATSCSICLDQVLDRGERSIARLQCGHQFHLDCIGSAFNAEGAMRCPNCRKVEKGRWLFSNEHSSSSVFDPDGWIATDDINDITYGEMHHPGYQWCPFGEFTQLTSIYEDIESRQNSYYEPSSRSSFADHSNASSSSHVCPYQARYGFPCRTAHALPSRRSELVPEYSHFQRHSTGLVGQPLPEMLSPHTFSSTEPPSHNRRQQPPPLPQPLASNSDQPAPQNGPRLSRNDTNNPQRLGSFHHLHSFPLGSISARSGSNPVVGSMAPPVHGEARTHARGNRSHINQPSVSSSPPLSSPFPPIWMPSPMGATHISTPTSTNIGGFYGFPVPSSATQSPHDSDGHYDGYYPWGGEGFAPLPWIPLDGDSRWWAPFNPNLPPQSGSFLQAGITNSERVIPNRPDNSYSHRWTPPPPPPPHSM